MTASTCKRERLRHTLVDVLWFRVAQHYLEGRTSDGASRAWQQCTQCGADLKAQDGFYHDDGARVREATSIPQVAAHVGIDRLTGTAADSILYTLEALSPSGNDVDLHGWLRADDDALKTLRTLLRDEGGRISVGHARTRGYGDVHVELGAATAPEDSGTQLERWLRWSSDMHDFLRKQFGIRDLSGGRLLLCCFTADRRRDRGSVSALFPRPGGDDRLAAAPCPPSRQRSRYGTANPGPSNPAVPCAGSPR